MNGNLGWGVARRLALASSILLLVILLLGCSDSRQRGELSRMMDYSELHRDANSSTTPGSREPGTKEQGEVPAPPEGGAPVATTSLKLIRTSSIQIEVKDFDVASRELGKLAASVGGYVADTQATRSPSGHRSGQVILKIPAERFDTTGISIRTLGKVLSERSTVEDVTKAYTDLETRLKVKRDALARIREILKTRAGNLKDILEAEREISRITEEIEQAEGMRLFYDHQIRLSTFTVGLQEPEPLNLTSSSSWAPLSEALHSASSTVATSLAALLSLTLILLPWLIAGFALYRAIRWMVRRRKAKTPGEPEAGNPGGKAV